MLHALVAAGYPADHDYPIDKIRLIYRRIQEKDAADQLVQLDHMRIAFASVMSTKGPRSGHTLYRKVRAALKRLIRTD